MVIDNAVEKDYNEDSFLYHIKEEETMQLNKTQIKVGASCPFSILHISDTHFFLADERDNERKHVLAQKRRKFFPAPEEDLREACAYAKEHGLTIVHTGDLIDFVSEANLDRAKRFMDENRVLFVAGNHEFSQYVGEAVEDEAYRNQSLAHVQSFFQEDIRFCADIINGVNFVGIDNGYYRFDRDQLDALKREAQRGYPIVLFVHNPLYEPSLFEFAYRIHNGICSALVGVPEEKLETYKEERRIAIERADAITAETIEYIKTEPLIKAVLAGHIHDDFSSMLTDSLPQHITGMRSMRRIDFL